MKSIIKKILIYVLEVTIMIAGIQAVPVESVCATAASSFQIDFINVGQGDASLIQCDGHYMLIDGGDNKQSSLIYAYLKQRSINYLDYVIATHADADHVGGLSGALNYAAVGTAYCSVTTSDTKAFQNFTKYLNIQGKSITVPKAGDTFNLGSAKVTILGPLKSSSEANDNSIVLRIVYGNTSFIFTGDAEADEEADIVDSGYTLESTVLKVGHHGSKSSTGYRFLRAVSPKYAVISVGNGNSYGHPTEKVLSRLRDADVTTYRTDMQGHIVCVSDGKNVSFLPQKNADADTLAGAGAGQKSVIDGTASQADILIPMQSEQDASIDRSILSTDKALDVEESAAVIQQKTSQEENYVLNKNTHKFHYPNCKSVNQMKDKNKEIVTGTRESIISRGYEPCKNCNP